MTIQFPIHEAIKSDDPAIELPTVIDWDDMTTRVYAHYADERIEHFATLKAFQDAHKCGELRIMPNGKGGLFLAQVRGAPSE